jgi:hypothetical protein
LQAARSSASPIGSRVTANSPYDAADPNLNLGSIRYVCTFASKNRRAQSSNWLIGGMNAVVAPNADIFLGDDFQAKFHSPHEDSN